MNFPAYRRGGGGVQTVSTHSLLSYPEARRTNMKMGGAIKDDVIAEMTPVITESIIKGAKSGIIHAGDFASKGLSWLKRKLFGSDSDQAAPPPQKRQRTEASLENPFQMKVKNEYL